MQSLGKVFVLIMALALFGCQNPTPMFNTMQSEDLNPNVALFFGPDAEQDPAVAEAPTGTEPDPVPLPAKIEMPAAEQRTEEAPALYYAGDFPLATHQRVEKLIHYYTHSGRKTFGLWLERAARYVPAIQETFAAEQIPLDLAYLALIESGFNMRAYSWAHAAGPWQFIESTGKLYDLKNDWWQDGRLDPEKSTKAAARHLKYLNQRFDGDWYLAVAAYNAGGGTVRRAIRKSDSRDFWVLTKGRVLKEETCNYLPKLLAALTIIKDLESYGFADLEFQPPWTYDYVAIESSTDLEIIAGFCEVDYKVIKELNPELKRWCTPPGVKNYRLRVPAGTAERVTRLYAQLPADQRASYYRHQIQAGDTLQVLARKYGIRVDDIVALNKIRNPRALQIGQNLILPLREGYTARPLAELGDSYKRSRRQKYTVRKGDSLWSIARRFDVTQKQLRVWNKLGWSNHLQPGQVLLVSSQGARKVALATSSRTTGTTRKMIYKVAPGDTLWGIGRQFNVATEDIRQWNELSKGHVLRPGQKLTLMVAANSQG